MHIQFLIYIFLITFKSSIKIKQNQQYQNIILFKIIIDTYGYDVLYETELTGDVGCINDPKKPIWLNNLNQQIKDCVYKAQCNFSVIQSQISVKISLDLTQYVGFYSYYGVEILFNSDGNSISGIINNKNLQTMSNLKNVEYEDKCAQVLLKKAFFFQNGDKSTDGSNFQLQIQKDNSATYFEIRKIRVYTNCVQNCLKCEKSNSCSQCNYGFTKVKLSNGNYVCEQTAVCSSISNCFSCIIYNNNAQCLTCLPGYNLISNTSCTPQSGPNCLTNSNSQCQAYSTTCIFEDRYGNYKDCGTAPNIVQNYKCPQNKQLIFLQNQNNDIYSCVCKVLNCLSCSSQATCEKCMDGYYLLNNKCFPCFDNNCKECTSFKDCSVCNDGYQYDSEIKYCYPNCPIGQKYEQKQHLCNDCLENCLDCSPTQCFRCIDENFYQVNPAEPQKCIRTKANKLQQSHYVTETGYIITLTFQEDIDLLNKDIYTVIEVTLSKQIMFNKEITLSKNKIDINLILEDQCKESTLMVVFTDLKFYQNNFLSQNNIQIQLSNYVPVSQSSKELSNATSSIGQSLAISAISTILPIVILSNFYILINTIDLAGFLYYLLFINIRYPENVSDFLNFIPNVLSNLSAKGYIQSAPKKFTEMSNGAYFIDSTGQNISIAFYFFIFYLLIKFISKLRIYKLSFYLQNAIQRSWEYSAFFAVLHMVYIYITIGVFLQFTVFEYSDETYAINYLLLSFWGFIVLPMPFILTWYLFMQKNLKNDKQTQQTLSSVVGGLALYNENILEQPNKQNNHQPDTLSISIKLEKSKPFSEKQQTLATANLINVEETPFQKRRVKHMQKLSRLCVGFLYIRKFLFSLIIVYMGEQQFTQICLICSLNLILASYILYICPYQKKFDNIKNAITEIFLLAIYAVAASLIDDGDQKSEDERFSSGWIIIGLSTSIFLLNTLDLLIITFKSIYRFIKSLKNKKLNVSQSPDLIPDIMNNQNAVSIFGSQDQKTELRTEMKTELKTELKTEMKSEIKIPSKINQRKRVQSTIRFQTKLINDNTFNNTIESQSQGLIKEKPLMMSVLSNQHSFVNKQLLNDEISKDQSVTFQGESSPDQSPMQFVPQDSFQLTETSDQTFGEKPNNRQNRRNQRFNSKFKLFEKNKKK